MNLSAVACKAAGIMSEKGHCKNAPQDKEGRVCFAGAVSIAMGGTADMCGLEHSQYEGISKIQKVAGEILREQGYRDSCPFGYFHAPSPVAYNNDPAISGEDVVLLLKRTAERLSHDSL